ncbi:fimbrial protein [Providencia alcalifaciens]|uniref:fimbrial protein n=1 Tax=Providencia alcalifaciens TaxID=126385 RepID=UPI0015EC5AC5|nr:fimbrial protein [Providencia alcalifaciens]QLQ97051.1 fimbrial protein [Providencia alcalifaciens]
MRKFTKSWPIFFALFLNGWQIAQAEKTEIRAVITDDVGCEIRIPNVLQFTPKRTSDFTGAITTHEIKPLKAQFICVDKTGNLTPKITLQGNPPYNESTIFLDGTPNSTGFMLRLSDGTPLSLSDFYDPSKAFKRGEQIALTPLTQDNAHQTEETFLVGLVGPIDGEATPGEFSASLTFNLIFQ